MKSPAALSDKDALIAALMERVEVLVAQNAALMAGTARLAARVVELESELGLPPKTPARALDPAVLVRVLETSACQ